jgi:molybdopterin synthase catalytic subunit
MVSPLPLLPTIRHNAEPTRPLSIRADPGLTGPGAGPKLRSIARRRAGGAGMIRVQTQDFDPGRELALMTVGRTDVGGAVVFCGLVRDMADGEPIRSMTLEHYPGMTEKMLEEIAAEAERRWPLSDVLVIHRYGRLAPGDRIVLVITCSAHRQAAFESNMFLVDWLKTKAPFWKLEERASGACWVEAQASDDAAAARWTKAPQRAAE